MGLDLQVIFASLYIFWRFLHNRRLGFLAKWVIRYGRYAADIWRTYGGHTADMRRIYGGYTADGRQIYGGHTADMRRTCGGYAADMRLLDLRTYGGHTPF